MQQDSLFHEDIYDALGTDIKHIGGFKKVGSMLWPDKPADKAGENLNNCLNRTRPEKLDPEQIMFVIREAKKVGGFATLFFMADDAGFSRPQPIEPEDERAALQRQAIDAIGQFKTLVTRLERVTGAQ